MPTRLELRTRARLRADQDSADFPTDAAYNYYLDEARKEVWYDLLAAGWPVNYTSTTITATGASQYVVGSGTNVATIQGVYWIVGTTRTEVRRLNPGDKAVALSLTSATRPIGYEVMDDATLGRVVRLYPALVTGSFTVEYITEPASWTSDADTWTGPARSDELLVLKAAAKGVAKESRSGDAKALLAEYDALMAKVVAMASWVDQRNPAKIRDTRSALSVDPFDFQIWRPEV